MLYSQSYHQLNLAAVFGLVNLYDLATFARCILYFSFTDAVLHQTNIASQYKRNGISYKTFVYIECHCAR